MSKNKQDRSAPGYAEKLHALEIGPSALQRQVIAGGRKLLIILEGRDAAQRTARSSASSSI